MLDNINKDSEIAFRPITSDYALPTTKGTASHKKILEYFDKQRKLKIRGYTLYKGVPLIADNIIQQEYNNTLAIKIEDKQMISAKKGTPWIFVTSSGVVITGVIASLNQEKRVIFLGYLSEIEKGFHLRETIRYQSEEPMNLIINSMPTAIELRVVDINEYAMKVTTNNQDVLEKLLTQTNRTFSSMVVNNQTIALKSKYLLEASRREGESALVMQYFCNEAQHSILRNWFNQRQMEIIREVREFSNKF